MVVLTARQTTAYAESAKRRQILLGARSMFLREGFDAASMGDIAREAKVSKGTLYVYFDSKEDLFQTIVLEECEAQAERVFALDSNDHDVEAVLTRLGRDFIGFLGEPHRISSFRTVIAIAERMPELGRRFYAMGPTSGIGRVARYLEDQVKAGVLAVPDCELAAAQFLDSCKSTIFQALLFNANERASDERIAYVVATAVRTFLAAYKR